MYVLQINTANYPSFSFLSRVPLHVVENKFCKTGIVASIRLPARGYKTFFMFNSAEHEFFPAHKH